jgi:hypothetical protein
MNYNKFKEKVKTFFKPVEKPLMTEEQMAEREALPTKEARRDFMRNLPLPERKK